MARQVLELSIALSDNARTRPIIDGRVEAEGIRLVPTTVHPSEMFWRQLKFQEFDISEMSLSSFTIATSQGPTPWVALPIYTMRHFFHAGIMVRTDRGINKPADLKGKRVGVPEYQQTAALWTRGVLQHEFGVHARDMEWFMERTPERSHGGSTGFKPPKGVKLNYIPATTNIGEMLARGDLDATLLYLRENNLVDRSKTDLSAEPKVKTLFPDQAAEKRRYFAKTGIYPINHCMVVRRSLLEKYPWIALNIYTAMIRAKELVAADAMGHLSYYLESGLLDGDARAALKQDPMAYGIKAARPVLETIMQYVYEQGLAKRRMGLDEIFAKSTLDV
ncbi:MAG: PhnD/SsuA/transferrin family substrate-binding protein [Burkholderiales bacterium]